MKVPRRQCSSLSCRDAALDIRAGGCLITSHTYVYFGGGKRQYNYVIYGSEHTDGNLPDVLITLVFMVQLVLLIYK
jgi:hypothetical protein